MTSRLALAALSATGPVSQDNGFPLWYQDSNAIALGPCIETNRFCEMPVLGEQLGFNPFNPIVFPNNFPAEFGYFLLEMFPSPAGTILKRYQVALQGAFIHAFPVAGEQFTQVVMSVRVDNIPVTADYALMHPYGVMIFRNVQAGARIRIDPPDLPILIPPPFDVAAQNFVGPFLSSTDPVNRDVLEPVSGNIYLSNPITPVTVTGSPFATNFVRLDRVQLDAAGNITAVLETIVQENLFFLFGKKVASVDVTPQSLAFGEQNATPVFSDLTLTITNTSSLQTPLFGDAVVTGADAGDFTVISDQCSNLQLNAFASCTLTVRFSGAAGEVSRSATLMIPSAATTFSPLAVPLSGTIDTVPPSVLSGYPANNTTGPINTAISIQFDDDMDPASINASSFTLQSSSGPAPGLITFDAASKVAVLRPFSPLTQGLQYTARVKGGGSGVRDSAGNALQSDFTLSFTATSADFTIPIIIASNPANASSGIANDSTIRVWFSEPMNGLSVNNNTVRLETAAGQVQGTVSFDGQTSSATFTPNSPLAFGVTHTLTVAGCQDLGGNSMTSDEVILFISNFKPDTPQILAPSNGATGVAMPVTLRWSMPSDNDDNPLVFHLSVCNNASFLGSGNNCQQDIVVVARAETGTPLRWAGIGILAASLGMLGFAFAAKGGRKFMLVTFLTLALSSSIAFFSCGGSDGVTFNPQPTPPPVEEGVSRQVTGLQSGVTFYWKVEVDDGKGGRALSAVSNFTTR